MSKEIKIENNVIGVSLVFITIGLGAILGIFAMASFNHDQYCEQPTQRWEKELPIREWACYWTEEIKSEQ